ENVINKINKIKQVVAIPIETGEKGFTICAYYIADEAIAPSVIKNIIVTELPEYMIPNHFIQLDNMPLTVNNKIDKKALPIPVFNNQFEIIQPATQVEKQLHEIWADLLNIDKESFGINSNFFELGGHSLNGTLLLYKIEKKLGRLLPLSILFRYPELSNLAKYINSQSISQAPQKTMKSDKRDFYPLSPFQKGMFILQEQNANSTVYNMPSRFEISGNLDLNKLKTIINKIIERHDILRTSFGFRNNEPIQTVIEDVKIEINVINNEITKYKNVPEAFVKPFNLSLPPLLR
ncbi:MAG: hypothetical protein GY756_23625, partial [bacterium]|nr:hypothetical protein [bacterium]